MLRSMVTNSNSANMPAYKRSGLLPCYAGAMGLLVAAMLLSPPAMLRAAGTPSSRERLSLNADWRFIKGEPAGSEGKLSYETLKPWLLTTGPELSLNATAPSRPDGNPGSEGAYKQPAFDDTPWRKLNLPHDWGVEGPFKQEYPGETGKLPWWGVAWYRKHFTVPEGDSAKQVYLDIDGAMAYASVWLNGQFVGGWPYGYASWELDLTPYRKARADNVIAIRVENPPDSSRWYPGGGIYRNVWLVKTAPVHVGHWGTYITSDVTGKTATVNLPVKAESSSSADAQVRCAAQIYALDARGLKSGRPALSCAPIELKIGSHAGGEVTLSGSIANPMLWSLKQPNRYVAVTTVEQGGKVVDSCETPFGIRTIQFTPDNGFLLNGERVALNGVCDHHDLGALGSAINTRALERQVRILQEMGCNAIRPSHNPPAPELLDVCDRMGFVVMDEAFDCWVGRKAKNDYHLLFPDWH